MGLRSLLLGGDRGRVTGRGPGLLGVAGRHPRAWSVLPSPGRGPGRCPRAIAKKSGRGAGIATPPIDCKSVSPSGASASDGIEPETPRHLFQKDYLPPAVRQVTANLVKVGLSKRGGPLLCADNRHGHDGFYLICVDLTHWFSVGVSEMSVIIPRIQDSLSLSLSLSLSIGAFEIDIPA